MSNLPSHFSRNRTSYLVALPIFLIASLLFMLAMNRDANRTARTFDC